MRRSGDPDQRLDLAVPRIEIGIGDRPVKAQAVAGMGLEIIGAKAQRHAPPMVRPPAQHARTPPGKRVRPRLLRVWLARNRRAASHRGVVETKFLVGGTSGAQWRRLRRLEHGRFGRRRIVAAGLEQEDTKPRAAQRISGHSARCTRPDHDRIMVARQMLPPPESPYAVVRPLVRCTSCRWPSVRIGTSRPARSGAAL